MYPLYFYTTHDYENEYDNNEVDYYTFEERINILILLNNVLCNSGI